MAEKKKMGAGLVLSVITALVTVAGLVLYMMNCKTNYFINSGVNNAVVACLAAAAILEIVMIAASMKNGSKTGSGYPSSSVWCTDSICTDSVYQQQDRCDRIDHDF